MDSSSGPSRSARSRLAARLLRRAGHEAPEELLAEVEDASAEASFPRIWRGWQLLLLLAYGIRDRSRRRGSSRETGRALRPWLALKLAARGLLHRPGIPLVAALTLAVGFGAAAAIHSVYVGFVRPLPVPGGDRVVQIRVIEPGGETESVGAGLRREWSDTRMLTGLGAYRVSSPVLVVPGRGAVRVSAASLDPAVYAVLGVAPAIGRLPEPDEADAVLLSDEIWRQHFDADPGVMGREVRVSGRAAVVLGVMPERFGFPFSQRLWTTLAADDRAPAALVARLAPEATPADAAAELQGRLQEFREAGGEAARVRVMGFTEARGEGGEAVGLIALLILVVALLLVSSTNVANLLLVRAGGRARMLAVHVAIGAHPAQVAFQLLAEALLIALGGAAVGIASAWAVASYVDATLSGHWGYHWMEVAIRPSVVVFTLVLAALTAVACGVAPAIRLARADLTVPLKGDVAGFSAGRPSRWLVGAQVAFSSSAVVVAALMVSGLVGSQTVDERFPADEVRVASLSLDAARYEDAEARTEFRERLLQRLSARPEIGSVALASGLPGLNTYMGRLETDAGPSVSDAPPVRVATLAVSPRYAEVMNLRLLVGRELQAGDGGGDRLVAVVSESFAREHLEGEPLDRRIRVSGAGLPDRWAEVVGVVADVVIYADRGEDYRDWVYLPIGQVEPGTLYMLYRPRGEAVAARAAVRTVALALDSELPLGAALGVEAGDSLAAVLAYVRRLFMTIGVLGAAGGVAALLVAMIGLYGLLAFEVQSRVPEIGVRMALGANRTDVLRQIVRRGLRGLAPGLALGAAVAWLGAPLFGIFLMGAEARNPIVFAATAALYLAVGTLAALLPARRAAALDPASSLRAE